MASSEAGSGGSQTGPRVPAAATRRRPVPARAPAPAGWAGSTLTSFVGRQQEIEGAARALAEARLVTLTGPGGIGKTRLALVVAQQVASRFADGVVLVDLTLTRTDEDVAATVVDRLGLAPAGALSPSRLLAGYLADRALLLVLDNAEHVLQGCRSLAATALGAGEGVRVLATSRERLGISGERVLVVPTLAGRTRRSDAVRLLEERAATASGGFRLRPEDAAAAVEVCRRLDGLPLAIELAATRLRSMSLTDLVERLGDRFEMLNRGDPTARTQHRTLRAMVEWSWDLCSDAERHLWARMSVFVGGADLEAIGAICAPGTVGAGVLDLIDGLVDKSVLTVVRSGARSRYLMLETFQVFGRERLAGQGGESDELELRRAHAQYFLGLARRGCDAFYSAEQLDWTARLRVDGANLVGAFDQLESFGEDGGRAAVELASALRFHWLAGPWQEGRRVIEAAVDGYREPDETRLLALHVDIWTVLGQGDPGSAVTRIAEADRIVDALDSTEWRLRQGVASAVVRLYSGDPPADEEFERLVEGLSSARRHGRLLDREYLLTALLGRVLLLLATGELARSKEQAERLLGECEACGESWMRPNAITYLALGSWQRGDLAEAAAAAREALTLKDAFGDVFGIGLALNLLSGIAAASGDARRAVLLLAAARTLNRSVGGEERRYGPSADALLAEASASARTELGEQTFDLTLAEGGAMAYDDVMDLVQDLARPSRSPPARAGPARGVLSKREYEVATLVSTGMTNRMIADHLVLSPRTIDGHLERILAKLGFRSRAEVAAWIAAREAERVDD